MMAALPRIMVAPNGARRGKADHPALPVTIPEIAQVARECHAAGADGIHAHVRDAEGRHVLDAGLYAELLTELAHSVPAMAVQITTESAGRYDATAQRQLVGLLRPRRVSIALREILSDGDEAATARLFHSCAEAEIGVQHILYDDQDIDRLADLVLMAIVPRNGLQVLGSYDRIAPSAPQDLVDRIDRMRSAGLTADWAACAFFASHSPRASIPDRRCGSSFEAHFSAVHAEMPCHAAVALLA